MEGVASVARSRDGWIVWELPGKPVAVRMSPDVVFRLGMAVREGFRALPRRGLETGGLLIGVRKDVGTQVVVEINDFEPIESEHAAGPSYLLSDVDRRLLEAKISAHEAGAHSDAIVGFYRSHTRRDFAITMEDAALFSSYFRKSSDVFLLIKSNDGAAPTGGFIIREGGRVVSYSPYLDFAFDRPVVIPATAETIVRPLPPQDVLAPLPLYVPPPAHQNFVSPAPERNAQALRWPIWLVAAVGLALTIGLAIGIPGRRPALSPSKPGPSLGLTVSHTGNGLRLSWDHRASLQASHAVLWIKDGPEEQKFELDSKQVNEGSVSYWPKTSDINFRLELPYQGTTVTESVRAIGASAPAPAPVPPAVVAQAPAAVVAEAKPSPFHERPPQPPGPVPVPTEERPVPEKPVSRTFALPPRDPRPAPRSTASLPDPPAIHAAPVPPRIEHTETLPKPMMPATSTVTHEGTHERLDSSWQVSAEPLLLSASRLGHLTRNIPLLGKRSARPDYVPPAPLRKPELPRPPDRDLMRDVNIEVKVYVNRSGKVDFSEVLSNVTDADRDLAALAMFSARQWEFAAARTGDGAVPGEVILHYHFGPTAR